MMDGAGRASLRLAMSRNITGTRNSERTVDEVKPADDGERERPVRLGARFEPQRRRDEADDGRQAGHRDRNEARARRRDDRLDLVGALR